MILKIFKIEMKKDIKFFKVIKMKKMKYIRNILSFYEKYQFLRKKNLTTKRAIKFDTDQYM